MKKSEHVKKAVAIGKDSWELINYMQLPENATKEQQVEALKSDARWQEDHVTEIVREINGLCREIEEHS